MYRTLVQMFDQRVSESPLVYAQMAKDDKGVFVPVTYIQLQEKVRAAASSLRKLGVKRGDRVGLLSDNRAEWLVMDLAILALGAADVPRGRDAMEYEIEYMLSETDARVTVVENAELLKKLLRVKGNLPSLESVILIDPKGVEDASSLFLYDELLEEGMERIKDRDEREIVEREVMLGSGDDIATIIFTSGTTGRPKGVMTTHANFLYIVECAPKLHGFEKGERWLSVLPVWHSFERLLQYMILFLTNTICYSKPIGKIMLYDLQRVNPHYMGSVPRIWETVKAGVMDNVRKMGKVRRWLFAFFLNVGRIYSDAEKKVHGAQAHTKSGNRFTSFLTGVVPYILLRIPASVGRRIVFRRVKEKLGRNFIFGISGGGSMGKDTEVFFSAMGIKLLNGYGMTETSPVIAISDTVFPKTGFIEPLPGTEVRVLREDGSVAGTGEKGELWMRGPQRMKGYWRDEEKTREIIDSDGWLRTGDLAVLSKEGSLSLVGRAKDTIVLSGGENVEPVPIEEALLESPYIESAVVVGQDRKTLGALIVPEYRNVERYLKENGIVYLSRENLEEMDEVKQLLKGEAMKKVCRQRGFKAYEEISRMVLLHSSFTEGRELSAKGEIRRSKVLEIYSKEIDSLYS